MRYTGGRKKVGLWELPEMQKVIAINKKTISALTKKYGTYNIAHVTGISPASLRNAMTKGILSIPFYHILAKHYPEIVPKYSTVQYYNQNDDIKLDLSDNNNSNITNRDNNNSNITKGDNNVVNDININSKEGYSQKIIHNDGSVSIENTALDAENPEDIISLKNKIIELREQNIKLLTENEALQKIIDDKNALIDRLINSMLKN